MENLELITDDLRSVKDIKTLLEENDMFIKPMTTENGKKVIKTKLNSSSSLLAEVLDRYKNIETRPYQSQLEESNRLVAFTTQFFSDRKFSKEECNDLVQHLPIRYTLYNPLALFNNSSQRSFMLPCWQKAFEITNKNEFFEAMLKQLFPQCTHVAVNMPIIEEDVMRRPFNIVPLHGILFEGVLSPSTWSSPTEDDFNKTLWCHVIQNGIHQVWAPAFTMFSRGNVKEKKRILDSYEDIQGLDVVDLYAGIGYFTLSYLKRGARRVFCFELNPWSTEGLQRGVNLNDFLGHCYVYNESNEKCSERLAAFKELQIRHINLGLLPTSVPGYSLAVTIIRNHSLLRLTTLHIHENVHTSELMNDHFIEQTLQRLKDIDSSFTYKPRHLEKIKTFAPDVWHVCLDVDVIKTELSCTSI